MGQYFKAINLDKREVVCPWCLHGGAKLWEWAANPQGAILTLLLRKSTGSGGGDYYGPRPDIVTVSNAHALTEVLQARAAMEGRPFLAGEDTVVGRWAGDRIALVGDYDESELFDESESYRNISRQLVETWNPFIELKDMQLKFNSNCGCNKRP